MLNRKFDNLYWQKVSWQRPFELETVQEILTHLASVVPRGPVVWEIRGNKSGISHLLGTEREHTNKLNAVFTTHGNIQFFGSVNRKSVNSAKQLKISKPILSLKTDTALAVIRAGLATMANVSGNEELVLQIVLGPSYSPSPIRGQIPDPHASWLQVVSGNVGTASPESRAAGREKTSCSGFLATVRIGSYGNASANNGHIFRLFSALRILESAGVRMSLDDEKPEKLDSAHVPWHFSLRLSVKELSNLFLLPIGDTDLPGMASLHPKLLLPPTWYKNPQPAHDRTFAVAKGAPSVRLSISPTDSLEHTIILGPTGSGKSTAMQNLILADIAAGRGTLVIDPKYQLVNDLLERIPANRAKDVIVIDPSAQNPVGFNPFNFKRIKNPGLVADTILAVLHDIFSENWGIRSQDILSGALLTLAQLDNASLIQLPALLTDTNFRQKITSKIDDKLGLEPFWAEFDAMGKSERNQNIAPVMNKLRQFLLRPGLRNVLGQLNPKFSLSDLLDKQKIVLVSLNKGIVGKDTARLLGSLIVGMTWTLALSRADLPPERRFITSIFIDELQDYLSLPTDLSDALAQARGLGVGLTLAHQYREQLPPKILAGVDANARSKIVFGLKGKDAKSMVSMAPELDPEDFMLLPCYQVYTSFQSGGRNTGWIQGQTFPAPAAIRNAAELRALSMSQYGRPVDEIEAEYLTSLGYATTSTLNPPITEKQQDLPEPENIPTATTPQTTPEIPAVTNINVTETGTIGRKKRKKPTDQPPSQP